MVGSRIHSRYVVSTLHLVPPEEEERLAGCGIAAGQTSTSSQHCIQAYSSPVFVTTKSCSLAPQHPTCPAQHTPQSHSSHHSRKRTATVHATYICTRGPRLQDTSDIYLRKTGICYLVCQGESDPCVLLTGFVHSFG